MDMPEEPVTPPNREHVLAAAAAAAVWIRARRASWTGTPVLESTPEPAKPPKAPKPPYVEPSREQSYIEPPAPVVPPVIHVDVYESEEEESAQPPAEVETEPAGPSLSERAATAAAAWREPIVHALPRVAVLVVLIAVVGAGVTYWPKLRTSLTSGAAVLESAPPGSDAFVDGRLVGKTPIVLNLPAGTYQVELRNGDQSRKSQVVVVARGRVVQYVDWLAKPTGGLKVMSEPTGARVLVDGALRGTTPLTLDGVAAGTHAVTIESSAGSIRRTVTIEVGQTTLLNEAISLGWLAVFSPIEIQITEGGRALTPDERGRVLLSPGPHKVRLQNRALGYDEVRSLEIKPAETTALTVTPQTTIAVTATEPAEVLVDGAKVGDTPLTGRKVNFGTHEVIVKSASGNQRRFEVTATAKPVQLDVDFAKP